MKNIGIGFFVVLISVTSPVLGADIFFRENSAKRIELNIYGPMEAGDGEKLESLIKNEPSKFLGTRIAYLSSDGGNVIAAMKLARVVSDSGLTIGIPKGELCASSCFFVFAAAQIRLLPSKGQILIHRPYFEVNDDSHLQHSDIANATESTIAKVREYLEAKGVASSIVDKMMRLPSSDAYPMSFSELLDFGTMSPAAEEYAISKCGFSNKTMYDRDKIPNHRINPSKCALGLGAKMRIEYLSRVIGPDATRKAIKEAEEHQNQERS